MRSINMGNEEHVQVSEPEDLSWLIPARSPGCHKGTAGRVLLYAGSMGFAGAAAMAALASLRAGAGLVTILCSREMIPILQTLAPNAMCRDIAEGVLPHDVLAAGCGVGQGEQAAQQLENLLHNESKPVILDADALNIWAKIRYPMPSNTVITPHVGEAARMLTCEIETVSHDMITSAKKLYDLCGATVVLKSAETVIYDGKTVAVNQTGSPSLAKGGSGDALCGILAALLADRELCLESNPLRACQAACLWLGLAGLAAEEQFSDRCALTTDVISLLPGVLVRARNHQETKE